MVTRVSLTQKAPRRVDWCAGTGSITKRWYETESSTQERASNPYLLALTGSDAPESPRRGL